MRINFSSKKQKQNNLGSFNKIGFVSNLPIVSGDKTVLIFTTVNEYRAEAIGGVTYSDDAYVPTLLPIFGEYDDYGKIDCKRYKC